MPNTPNFPATIGDTGSKSLIFDANLGAAGDLDIDTAEFVRYYKPSYKNGQLCLKLTQPALSTLLDITSAHEVTHENVNVMRAQYNTLKRIEQDIAKGRKSWNLWKKFDANRKIPMFVAAAYNLLTLTAMTSREVAEKMQLVPTQQTETISVQDILPTEQVTKIVVPLEGLPPEDLSALDEYMERHQRHDDRGLNVVEEGHEDEFSDNASTIRQSTFRRDHQAASSSSPTSRPPTPTPTGNQQEDPDLTTTLSSRSNPIIFAIFESYHNCTITRDSATSTVNSSISSPRGSDFNCQESAFGDH